MKFFFNALMKFLIVVANIFLAPINSIVSNVFPSFSSIVSQFTTTVNTYLGGALGYFFSILPTNTANLVLLYVSLLIIFYTLSLASHIIIKVVEIIKNVKVW